MKKIFILFTILFLLMSTVSAGWFAPPTPPPMVYNNNTNLNVNNLTANGFNMFGDLLMNNHYIYDAFFVNATFVNMTVITVNYTQVTGLAENYVPYVNAIKDVDLGNNSLTTTGNITSDNLLVNGLITTQVTTGNNTLWVQSEINKYSCVNLMETSTLGFSICNDGSGTNRLVFSSHNTNTTEEAFSFDRDTGTIELPHNTDVTGNLSLGGSFVYYCSGGVYSGFMTINSSNCGTGTPVMTRLKVG